MASGLWLDQNLTVTADTVYVNPKDGEQVLVGKNVEITFPEVKNITVDATAMGVMSVPVIGQFENMEATIHKIGVDKGLSKMLAQKTLELEIRWIEQVMLEGGSQTMVGCKAFLTGFPTHAVPEIGIKAGEAVDIEVPYTVKSYKVIKNGEVLWNIDRISEKLEIDGEDYFEDMSSLL